MHFKNYPTCHCHQASFDSASSPESFVQRELELGTGCLVVTDHGTLQAGYQIYDLAKKNGLTPIVGLEAYLRDDDCPILKNFGFEKQHPLDTKGEPILKSPKTLAYYSKYFHLTMHAMDAVAYEALVGALSRADLRAEKHGSQSKPLFTWADLEELGSHNITMTSSCLGGVVQNHLVEHSNVDIAAAYYEKMRSICKPGNWYAEIAPHKNDQYWESVGFIVFEDGAKERLRFDKRIWLKDAGKVILSDIARRWKDGRRDTLVSIMENRQWVDRPPKEVVKVEAFEGFLANECRPWAPDGDLQRGANELILALAQQYGDKILIGDDSHYATAESKIVQDIRLQAGGGSWRFYGHHHRQTSEEAYDLFRDTLHVSPKEFESWVDNGYEWVSRFREFDFKKRKSLPVSFYPKDTLDHTMSLIEKHGRMRWEDPVWVDRLEREIKMLFENGQVDLLPYFMIAEEACELYAKMGKLTGPGRGSAAGMLLAYLLRITHVDPIRYQLSMERFLTASRIRSGKWPDIDMDFPDRDPILKPGGWLDTRFAGHYARISTNTSLKLRSAVKDVARVIHEGVPREIEILTANFVNAPQGVSDSDFVFGYKGSAGWVEGSIKSDTALQEYIRKYPREWKIVQQCLGLTRSKSVHACGVVITDEPIDQFLPLVTINDVRATQYTASSVEAVGGVKLDFLQVNSIRDIESAIGLIQDRHGRQPDQIIGGELVRGHEVVVWRGKPYSIWNLPEDQAVFNDICEGKTETVFQFNTKSAVGWLKGHFNHDKPGKPGSKALDSIEALSAFTALDRPGPLDFYIQTSNGKHNMLVEYSVRARGGERSGGLPILDELLPETYGVIVYQEQLQRVYQEVGGTSAEQADEFRVHISKKMMSKVIEDKEVFLPGAVTRLGEQKALELWESMETFGQYGFNKSHATAYVATSYACAFLKHHFPLEWWTAVLRNADKTEVATEFWPHCGHLIGLPDVSKSRERYEIVDGRIQAPLSLLDGIGPAAHAQLVAGAPYTSLADFCQKIVKHQKDNTKDGKPGRNAITKGVVATLIVTGALDAFYDKDTVDADKMTQYVTALATARGLKRPRAQDMFPKKYTSLTSFSKLQMKKIMLPVYHDSLIEMLKRCGHPAVSENQSNGRLSLILNNKRADIVDWGEIQHLSNLDPWPEGAVLTVGSVGYLADARRFNYGDGKKKEAIEMVADIDGGQVSAVHWPDRRSGLLPQSLKKAEDLIGSVVLLLYTKYRADKPFSVEEVLVIQPPLGLETEESPA